MAVEIGADELPVPGPLVLGIRGGVDACDASTLLHERLQSLLLSFVEDVARRAEHDDHVEARETVRVKDGCVFGRLDRKAMRVAQLTQRLDTVGDGGVAVPFGLGEHQNVEAGLSLRRGILRDGVGRSHE